MDSLTEESVDWALTHVKRFGDTDIFPVPFEYQAISHNWARVKAELIKIDLATYEGRSLQRFLIPKPHGGYRVAIQLDPLDNIIYLAMVYEAAEKIESSRIPADRKIACSYRVEIDAQGQMFRDDNGWNDFHSISQDVSQNNDIQYVVIADIADFYNQASHHRIRNALELADISSERAKNFENFLMNLTRGHSRGIPVGPAGSIVLAEACLNDVDLFLLRKGYTHTRYVDDFRIFCKSKSEAFQTLHDLSEYLYTSHRLAIQSSKTKILAIDQFVSQELSDLEILETNARMGKINEAIKEAFSEFSWYNTIFEDSDEREDEVLTDEDVQRIVRENLTELFDECLHSSTLHLGLARYLIRRATKIRTNVLQRRIIQNLDKLAPVMRDVANYLMRTLQQRHSNEIGQALINFMNSSDLSFIPYLQLWVANILIEKHASQFEASVQAICQGMSNHLGKRSFALLARKQGYVDWIREQKETWQNNGPWDRRAIIWAAEALPSDERGYWLKRVQNASDLLDGVTAIAVINNS